MSKVQRFWCDEARNIRCVREDDFDALEAEAQALREQVARSEQHRNDQADLIVSLRTEVTALRARVAVVPERKLLNAGVPGLNRNSGWNACLDELARLNGMTVSEGLLRRIVTPALTSSDAQDRIGALEELRALLSEQAGEEP
ncbi:hypothetical protein N0406_03325 [Pseudomonas aeruginosa]|nr:hypothetical protein [Pseudomonas aeruginosa]